MNEVEIIKNIIRSSDNYKNVIILDDPVPFDELMKDKDFAVVSIHFLYDEKDIIFGGSFKWKNNELTSIDGDSYNPKVKVYGYEVWHNDKFLEIIVENDW